MMASVAAHWWFCFKEKVVCRMLLLSLMKIQATPGSCHQGTVRVRGGRIGKMLLSDNGFF